MAHLGHIVIHFSKIGMSQLDFQQIFLNQKEGVCALCA
jgi:hypothetical protein